MSNTPSNTEAWDLWLESITGGHHPASLAKFARAVLEKWGTPQSADCTRSHPHEDMSGYCLLRTEIARLANENARLTASQPVVLESSEDLYWKLHGLSKILEGSGSIDESRHPDAYSTILDAMAFIRGSQPVVREPLTPSQYNIALGCATDIPPSRYEVVTRAIERAHGITQKGDQHG